LWLCRGSGGGVVGGLGGRRGGVMWKRIAWPWVTCHQVILCAMRWSKHAHVHARIPCVHAHERRQAGRPTCMHARTHECMHARTHTGAQAQAQAQSQIQSPTQSPTQSQTQTQTQTQTQIQTHNGRLTRGGNRRAELSTVGERRIAKQK